MVRMIHFFLPASLPKTVMEPELRGLSARLATRTSLGGLLDPTSTFQPRSRCH